LTICHFWLIQRSIVVDGDWQRSEYAIEGEQLQTTVNKAQFPRQVKGNSLSITPDNSFTMCLLILKILDEVDEKLAMSYDTCALLLQAIAFPACD
jgi:hypothetical protein